MTPRGRARRRSTRPAPLLVLSVAALILVGCGPGPTQPTVPAATLAPFPGNTAAPAPLLVDAAWLRARLVEDRTTELRLLDLSPPRTYRRGHVPGAVHAWWQDTMDRFYPAYGVVLAERQDPGARARLLATLGIGDRTLVVAYDGARNRYAARLIWMLRYFGHERSVVLDGGLAAWRAAGGPVGRDAARAPRVEPAIIDPQPGYIIGTRELRQRLGAPPLVLLDTRTEEEAADDLNGTIRRGRLPGAVVLPWTATLRDAAGRLGAPETLAALFAAAGVTPDKEVVVYARFGVETAQPWLVLKLLGYPNVRVYDQGWAEWAAKPELPIEPLNVAPESNAGRKASTPSSALGRVDRPPLPSS